ncbi:MAG: hypothetical protein KBG80_12440, partial [Breznakibacter sp.]|nr:hypothetical protein [Breznakibacter sp.]
MQKRLLFLLKTTIFWLLLFLVARFLFECYNFTGTKDLTIGEIILTFLHGFRLDLSMTSYFMLAYGLIVAVSVFFKGKYIHKIVNGLTYLLIFTSLFIVVVDFELFRNWGFRMDATPLQYINTPGAALASTPYWATVLFVLFWILLSTTASVLYSRYISKELLSLEKIRWYFSPLLILLTATYVVSARGTFSEWPIRVSTVAFSTKQFANHASINVVWNFMRALSKKKGAKVNTQLIDHKTAKTIFTSIQPT